MVKFSSFALLLAAFLASPGSRAADITGIVTLKGTPPPEIEITPLEDDPTCGALHMEKPMTQFYVVGKNGELADVVVLLKDAGGRDITGKATGTSAPPAVLDQKGCLYAPTILAVQTGQKIVVKNSDPCIHNVHCTPTVAGNEEQNDAQMPGGADLTYTFSKPEMFLCFKCDVHPWMFAWVSVIDSPYFSVSGNAGKFVIKNVPPGKYIVVANHRKLGEQKQAVEVTDKDVTVNFTFNTKTGGPGR
jgi:plastocyanin